LIREIIDSGHLEKGNEISHISWLLHIFAGRALQEIYRKHKQTDFAASVAVTILPAAIDSSGILGKTLAQINDKSKFWKNIRDFAQTQIRILQAEAESLSISSP
jgi:hypothetical protein